MSRREFLKAGTAAHRLLDGHLGCFDLADPRHYARFLTLHVAALPPLEAALARSGAEELIPDWPERRRTALLLDDLDRLGVAHPPWLPAPENLTPAEVFGVAYVLEGSRLGAAILARRMAANPDPACRTATGYLRHGEGLRLWPAFVAMLEASPHPLAEPEATLSAALTAFALFAQAASGADRRSAA